MRCLVTGASGFLGSHLVHELIKEGNEVCVVARKSSNLWRLTNDLHHLRIVYSALSELEVVADEVKAFRPECVFHLAWAGGNSRKFVNDVSQVFDNLPGSLDLVRLSAEAGCSRYLFLGSAVEYGTWKVPVRETDIPEPSSLYGMAKLAATNLTQSLCTQFGIRFCGIRLFWAYGPMDDRLRMIPSVISGLLAGKRPSLTAGEQIWDFLYVEDAVRALVCLAESDSASGIFNLGSGVPVTVREMVMQIRDTIDPALDLGFGDISYPPGQPMHLQADISRLKAAVAWSPNVSIPEGIRRTVDWYRKQG